MKRWAVASALALWSLPAIAAPPVSAWTQPTRAQVYAAWPPEAAKQGLAGSAAMRCQVDEGGALGACVVVNETPSGKGFGQALMSLAPLYRVNPARVKAEAPKGETLIAQDWHRFDKAADWLRKPTGQDLLVVWPKEAWRKGIGGKAVITCLVSLQGALFDCGVVSEEPEGQHFGAAAIALTPQFLMRPASLDGQPVVSTVHIPVNFAWPGGPGSGGGGSTGHKVAQPAMAWLEAPSYAQVIAAYPKKAKAEGVVGRATLNCEFMSTGKLEHCNTVAEEPKGQGFADAAKALSKQFRAPAKTSDGASLAGVDVQLPFAFDRSMQTEKIPAVGTPKWASLPTAEETAAAFGAVSKTVEGTVRVMLTCTVQAGGTVDGCTVAREEPAGKGVAQAALSLAPHFRLTTWTMEGLPTIGATINIPLRYEGGPPAETPAKP